MTKLVKVMNTVTGKSGVETEFIATHPVFGKSLVIVKDTVRSNVPELYRPKTVEEYTELYPDKVIQPDGETEIESEQPKE